MLGKIKENLIEMIFPSHCAYCDRIGSFLCQECQKKILTIKNDSCPSCNALTKMGRYCPRCKKKTSINGVIATGYLKDNVLKEAIHEFKYERISGLSPIFANLMLKKLQREGLSFDVVSYVPITKKREAWRGFNQAELLATEIANGLGLPLGRLRKVKETKTQVGLTRKERVKNLNGVFAPVDPRIFMGKTVLLIDDVVTTGTTLNECAKTLKQNGAKKVYGAVLAKE